LRKVVAWMKRIEGVSRARAGRRCPMLAAWILSVVNRLLGVAEVAVLLAVLSPSHSLGFAFLVQSSAQLVAWVTSFVPMQIGTAEGGALLLFRAAGLSPEIGVTLELARKLRRIAFAAFGVGLLGITLFRRLLRGET
jgi:hypothetical protein